MPRLEVGQPMVVHRHPAAQPLPRQIGLTAAFDLPRAGDAPQRRPQPQRHQQIRRHRRPTGFAGHRFHIRVERRQVQPPHELQHQPHFMIVRQELVQRRRDDLHLPPLGPLIPRRAAGRRRHGPLLGRRRHGPLLGRGRFDRADATGQIGLGKQSRRSHGTRRRVIRGGGVRHVSRCTKPPLPGGVQPGDKLTASEQVLYFEDAAP